VSDRRVPRRICVGCRRGGDKRELIRIAAGPLGVRVDLGARLPGRGAYVHPDAACLDAALARGALARALRTGLDSETAARLRTDVEREMEHR
jgi:predicted RNA-binding protein YlxR (DUF448 family)